MYLLDTNVLSELRKGVRANPGVSTFFARLEPEAIHLPVQTIGEIRHTASHAFVGGVTAIRPTGSKPGSIRCWRSTAHGS